MSMPTIFSEKDGLNCKTGWEEVEPRQTKQEHRQQVDGDRED